MAEGDKFRRLREEWDKQRGGEKTGIYGSLIKIVVYFIILTVALVFISNKLLGQPLISVSTGVAVIAGALGAIYLSTKPIETFATWGIVLLVVSVVIAVAPGALYGFEGKTGIKTSGVWDSIKCIGGNFLNVLNFDPSKPPPSCPSLTGKTPEAEKQGVYDIINVRFGSEAGGYQLPQLFGARVDSTNTISQYIFPIEVENLDKENPIKGLSVKGTVFNSTGDVEGTILTLFPDVCSESKTCEIKPQERKTIVMDSKTSAPCRKSSCQSLYLKVTTKYSYSAEGKNTFIIAMPESMIKSKATKSSGPLDVTVYFTPDRYDIGVTTVDEVWMFIILTNKGDGKAILNKIEIDESGTGLKRIECFNPFQVKFTPETFAEDFKDKKSQRTVTKEQPYKCKYDATSLKGIKELEKGAPFQQLPFTVSVDYVYEEDHPSKTGMTVLVNWI